MSDENNSRDENNSHAIYELCEQVDDLAHAVIDLATRETPLKNPQFSRWVAEWIRPIQNNIAEIKENYLKE